MGVCNVVYNTIYCAYKYNISSTCVTPDLARRLGIVEKFLSEMMCVLLYVITITIKNNSDITTVGDGFDENLGGTTAEW